MAAQQAAPVAVSLDPHRLLTLEWFIERLRDRGNNWQQDADNWRHGRGQRTREKRGYEVLDACGGSLLELADGFAEELARLRGEATVRPEKDDVKICTFCAKGQPAFYLQSGTGNLWHRNEAGQLYKCLSQLANPATVRVEE